MKQSILSTVLLSALLLSACGTGEEDVREQRANLEQADEKRADEKQVSETQRVRESIAHVLVGRERSDLITVNMKQANCIAGVMLDRIGVDELKSYGFLNPDGTANEKAPTPRMSRKDAKVMVDSMFECTDAMATMRKVVIKSTGEQSRAMMRTCFANVLTEKVVRDVLADAFQGKQQRMRQRLIGPFSTCAGAGAPQSG